MKGRLAGDEVGEEGRGQTRQDHLGLGKNLCFFLGIMGAIECEAENEIKTKKQKETNPHKPEFRRAAQC